MPSLVELTEDGTPVVKATAEAIAEQTPIPIDDAETVGATLAVARAGENPAPTTPNGWNNRWLYLGIFLVCFVALLFAMTRQRKSSN